MSGQSNGLPSGWTITQLGEIVVVMRGVTYKKQDASESPGAGLVPILRATNINRRLDFDELVYVPEKYVSDEQFLRIHDIVLAASSGSRSVVGKAAPLQAEWLGSFGAFCYVLRPDSNVDGRLIALFMQTSEYRNRVGELSAGVNINNLKREHLAGFPYPFPPFQEQQRVVAEIEKQFTRLDAAVAALKRVQANLKRYRAAVLKAACEGRLVPTEAELARKEGRSYKTGEQLLAHILKERRAKWEADQLAKMRAAGRPPKNDDWRKRYEEPMLSESRRASELPEGWTLSTSGRLFDCIVPNRDKPESFSGSIPWITLPDFDRRIQIESSKSGLGLTEEETKRYRARVIPAGSVVMSCIGRFGLAAVLGTSAVVNQQLHAFLVPHWLPSRFFAYALQAQRQYMERISTSTTISYLNKDNCNSVPIPLPPLAEQYRIVGELEKRLSIIDGLEDYLDVQISRSDRLRQSILKHAFEGKLVPQDPKDEPASALLERIRAGRKNRQPVVRRQSRKVAQRTFLVEAE